MCRTSNLRSECGSIAAPIELKGANYRRAWFNLYVARLIKSGMKLPLGGWILSALLFSLLTTGAADAVRRPIFDWMGISPIVVLATAHKASGRLPRLIVVESIRGQQLTPGQAFRIDRWLANDRRARVSDQLSLENDTEYLVLLRASGRRPRQGEPVFELVRGVKGILEVPPERGEALLAAVREFATIQARHDDVYQWERLRLHLSDKNVWLLESSLAMHIRFLRSDPDLIPVILPLLDHPRPLIRSQASRLIAETIALFPASENDTKYFSLHGRLSALARADEDALVREQAVIALDRLDDEGAETILKTIAEGDPDQRVRLAAATRLLERREKAQTAN